MKTKQIMLNKTIDDEPVCVCVCVCVYTLQDL
jgi:hypothetical protein